MRLPHRLERLAGRRLWRVMPAGGASGREGVEVGGASKEVVRVHGEIEPDRKEELKFERVKLLQWDAPNLCPVVEGQPNCHRVK